MGGDSITAGLGEDGVIVSLSSCNGVIESTENKCEVCEDADI